MWATEYFSVCPDIITFGKGIASGYPLSGIAGRKEIMHSQPPGSMGGTYAGNAVACAAANATIEIFQETDILGNTLERGVQIVEGIQDILLKHEGLRRSVAE